MLSARLGRRSLALVACFSLLAGCSGPAGGEAPSPPTPATSPTTEPAPDQGALRCAGLEQAVPAGVVSAAEATEISGLVASRARPGILWVHNDSGHAPAVYALRTDGTLLATLELPGTTARDWEDIALGPGPAAGTDYLYLADIGDNRRNRTEVAIHRVAEPAPAQAEPGAMLQSEAEVLAVRYPDGAHDAEVLLVDPDDGSIFIVTKEPTGRSAVFRVPWPASSAGPVEAEQVARLALGVGGLATGGDVSPDGRTIVVRTYGDARLWVKGAGSTVADALGGDPCRGPVAVERQGEAIGFAADGRGYYTVSEGEGAVISFVRDRSG